MKALLIEDKEQLADAIREYLNMHKINAVSYTDGLAGYQEARSNQYDVIILDLMLPSKDGLSIIKDLRKDKINTPILVLTAKISTDDKVECLLAGADDYVTKPFVLEELLARLYVLTRRKNQYVSNVVEYSDLALDKMNHTIKCGEEIISLSFREFQILELLVTNTERIVPKNEIALKIWGEENDSNSTSVEAYISFLRRKLKAIHTSVKIKSIRNVGYKLRALDDEEDL